MKLHTVHCVTQVESFISASYVQSEWNQVCQSSHLVSSSMPQQMPFSWFRLICIDVFFFLCFSTFAKNELLCWHTFVKASTQKCPMSMWRCYASTYFGYICVHDLSSNSSCCLNAQCLHRNIYLFMTKTTTCDVKMYVKATVWMCVHLCVFGVLWYTNALILLNVLFSPFLYSGHNYNIKNALLPLNDSAAFMNCNEDAISVWTSAALYSITQMRFCVTTCNHIF